MKMEILLRKEAKMTKLYKINLSGWKKPIVTTDIKIADAIIKDAVSAGKTYNVIHCNLPKKMEQDRGRI